LALAPGYWHVTDTVGGETCGNCASGRLKAAMPPASVMNTDSTAAKIGRSIKKREITADSPSERASFLGQAGRLAHERRLFPLTSLS
jgi:hypothetical protein